MDYIPPLNTCIVSWIQYTEVTFLNSSLKRLKLQVRLERQEEAVQEEEVIKEVIEVGDQGGYTRSVVKEVTEVGGQGGYTEVSG